MVLTYTKSAILAAAVLGAATNLMAAAGYISGDFHQHSTHSDGSVLLATTNSYNNAFGLDWWANSEHGGQTGSVGTTREYRWQDIGGYDHQVGGVGPLVNTFKGMTNTWLETQTARGLYTNKTVIQGLEFNTPGHEHTSTGIITNQYATNPNASPMAEFEYRFDKNDSDTSGGPGGIWTGKNTVNDKTKTLQAVAWLQANYATTSWFIPAHPERANSYLISDYRNFNNAAPTVAFGFESMPGHQKASGRGGYGTSAGTGTNQPLPAGQGGTFGGTGVYAAKVGGWWDAMNAEGRNWSLFASSDFHGDGDDFRPGEYQKTYSYVADKAVVANSTSGAGAQAVVDSLRSGNSWVVEGDLIDSLEFTVGGAMMGGKGATTAGKAAVHIKVRDPQADNPNNTYSNLKNPELNHIDLIAGSITGKISPFLADGVTANPAYSTAVSDARVIARFDAIGGVTDSNGLTSIAWTATADGYREINYDYSVTDDQSMFFRLRGTNQGLGVTNETDGAGNPLADSLMNSGTNTAALAFNDLWFYSNAVAVPEPTTLGFLGIAGALGLRRSRKA